MKQTIAIILLTFGWLTGVTGQTTIQHSFEKASEFSENITLDHTSEEYKIVVQVDKTLSLLHFKFSGLLNKGELTIIILDPNGKREGGFQLQARTSRDGKSSNTRVNGDMNKQIKNPLRGDWILTIQTNEAVGEMKLNTQAQG